MALWGGLVVTARPPTGGSRMHSRLWTPASLELVREGPAAAHHEMRSKAAPFAFSNLSLTLCRARLARPRRSLPPLSAARRQQLQLSVANTSNALEASTSFVAPSKQTNTEHAR